MKRLDLPIAYIVGTSEEFQQSVIDAVHDIEARGGKVIVDNTHFRVLRSPKVRREGAVNERQTNEDKPTGA